MAEPVAERWRSRWRSQAPRNADPFHRRRAKAARPNSQEAQPQDAGRARHTRHTGHAARWYGTLVAHKWDACNLFWLQELGAQIARGNDKLAARYGTRCVDELRTRQPRVASTPEPTAPDDLDGTAFMTALRDETALPFASPVPSSDLPFEKAPGGPTEPSPRDDTHEPHPDVGETQEVSALVRGLPKPPRR